MNGAETEWQEQAACVLVDPASFFAERGRVPASARQPCAACPVRDECLNFVLSSPYYPYGVWAGKEQWELQYLWERERGLVA